jgi:uncharacterized protein (DUF2267 family)
VRSANPTEEQLVNYKDMTRVMSGRTGLTRRRADEALVATLTVLSEQISTDETRDLLAQLPKALRAQVPVSSTVLEMRPIEFVARVADLVDGVSVDEADVYVRAVFATLNEAVNAGEMRDIAEELGPDFSDLLGRPVPSANRSERGRGIFDRIGGLAGAVVTLPFRGLAFLRRTVRQNAL